MTTGGAWFVMQNARRTGGGFDPPPWLRVVVYVLLALAVGGLVFLAGLLVTGCGGPAFEPEGTCLRTSTREGPALPCETPPDSAEAASLAISPASDGGVSEHPLTGSDGARGPGLDAADAGEFGGGEVVPESWDGAPDSGTTLDSPPPLPDHLSDPWPADVVVEPMPAPNCFVDFAGHDSCCRAVNQPPVYCEVQQSPHFCTSCPK